jgi:signal transduction histidine kinase
VRLKASLAPGIKVHLGADAAHILVSNLVMNAIQHSSPGSEVRIAVRLGDNGEMPAVFEVQDFGSGIAAENLPRVFDRFFREDPSRSRKTGGVGLGLAICKSITEIANGTIALQSVKGEGTIVAASFRTA